MILDLTDEQKAFQQHVRARSRADASRPQAAAIDERGAFPRDLVREAAALGLMGVTIAADVGRARAATTSATRSRSRRSPARARSWRSSPPSTTRSSPSRSRGSAPTRRSRPGCAGSRAGRRSAPSRCPRSTPAPTPPTSRPWPAWTTAGMRITGRKVWVANAEAADVAIVFAATQPGLRGRGITAFLVPMDTPGITRVARRRFARRARPRLHGSRVPRRPRRCRARCWARRARDSASRCGRSRAAASRLPRRRSASARRRSTRRSRTRGPARRSASRSATTRRSSGCSPTWPPSSTRPAC